MATNSVPEWSSIATSKLSTKLSTAPYVSWYYTGKANILLGLPLRYLNFYPSVLPYVDKTAYLSRKCGKTREKQQEISLVLSLTPGTK